LSFEGGSRRTDVTHLSTLLADAARRAPAPQQPPFESLQAELAQLDLGEDLPHALTHPDFGPANAIKAPDGDFVLVDWTSAGNAPRVISLGLLLSYVGGNLGLVEPIIDGYRSHVRLDDEELARLPDSIRGFALILACWGIVCWGAPAAQVVQSIAPATQHAMAVAAKVRDVLTVA
jgi:Ser/Thr protein kinase RdoA (MazF antagonist)